MKQAFDFLRMLEEVVPPSQGSHHSLCIVEPGQGFEGQNAVILQTCQSDSVVIFLEDDEIEKEPQELVKIIRDYMHE